MQSERDPADDCRPRRVGRSGNVSTQAVDPPAAADSQSHRQADPGMQRRRRQFDSALDRQCVPGRTHRLEHKGTRVSTRPREGTVPIPQPKKGDGSSETRPRRPRTEAVMKDRVPRGVWFDFLPRHLSSIARLQVSLLAHFTLLQFGLAGEASGGASPSFVEFVRRPESILSGTVERAWVCAGESDENSPRARKPARLRRGGRYIIMTSE